MRKAYTILIADYVPLANRGEEAILRGLEDLLGGSYTVRLGIFDNVVQPTTQGNVTVFPWSWLFRAQGNRALRGRRRYLHDFFLTLQMRCGYYGRLGHLIYPGRRAMTPLSDFFAQADLILVGHDGVFCTESCGVIHLAKRRGKRVGILGASAQLVPKTRWYKGWLYRRALRESDFVVFREQHARASLGVVAACQEKLQVAPDPAFAMRPAAAEAAQDILAEYPAYRTACQEGRPVVAVTVLEKGRVYARFRPDLSGGAKQRAHADYLADLLNDLVRQTDALIVFLPHAVEADASDVRAAERVVSCLAQDEQHTLILDRDLDARLLKAIIRECHFLVGERTHSLIAAVSTGTPFVGLTNTEDTRTHGIIGHMMQCSRQLVNMDCDSVAVAQRRLSETWSQRRRLSDRLVQMMPGIEAELQVTAHVARGVNIVY